MRKGRPSRARTPFPLFAKPDERRYLGRISSAIRLAP